MVRSHPWATPTDGPVEFATEGKGKGHAPEEPRAQARQPTRRGGPVRFGRNPDEAAADACARVSKLQQAIDVLDAGDPVAHSLQQELKKARAQARIAPVEDRIKSTTAFVESARKRATEPRRRSPKPKQTSAKEKPGWPDWQRKRRAQLRILSPSIPEGLFVELERLRRQVKELTAANSQYRHATLVEASRFFHSEVVAEVNKVQAELEVLRRERHALTHSLAGGPDEGRWKQAKKLGGPTLDLVPMQPRPGQVRPLAQLWIWHRRR